MKRIISLILAAAAVLVCCESKPEAEGTEISAQSAVLYDALAGEFLFEKNADVRRGMASTTKIMTAVLALELYDIEMQVEILPEWCGAEGSSMYLRGGELLCIRDLLYGLMLSSGNDAAYALACIYSGNAEDFVRLMNDKACALGLEDTHFDNPSGLDGETHYSTARDMALLAAHAMENEEFAEIVSCKSIRIGNRYLKNHNRLLSLLDGAVGIKTGFTKACGRCLVSSVRQNGRMLIAVTLNAPDDWNDHINMYGQAMRRFSEAEIIGAGNIGNVPVVSGSSVPLYISEGFSAYLRQEETPEIRISLSGPRFCYAPIDAGSIYGRLRVIYRGNTLFETAVRYGDSISREEVQRHGFWDKLYNIFKRE